MRNSEKGDRFSIDLGAELNDAIQEIARKQGLTKAEVIRRGLGAYAVLRNHVGPTDELIIRSSKDDTERLVVLG